MASVERTPTCTSVSMPKDGGNTVPLDVNFVDEYEHMSSGTSGYSSSYCPLENASPICRGYFSSANVRRAALSGRRPRYGSCSTPV